MVTGKTHGAAIKTVVMNDDPTFVHFSPVGSPFMVTGKTHGAAIETVVMNDDPTFVHIHP